MRLPVVASRPSEVDERRRRTTLLRSAAAVGLGAFVIWIVAKATVFSLLDLVWSRSNQLQD